MAHVARCKELDWSACQSGRVRLFKPGLKTAVLLNHSIQSSLGSYIELHCVLSAPDPATYAGSGDYQPPLGERSVLHMIDGRPMQGVVVAALQSLQREALQAKGLPVGGGKALRQERRALMKEYR